MSHNDTQLALEAIELPDLNYCEQFLYHDFYRHSGKVGALQCSWLKVNGRGPQFHLLFFV